MIRTSLSAMNSDKAAGRNSTLETPPYRTIRLYRPDAVRRASSFAELSDDASPVEEISSAPVIFMMSLARLISSEVSQWTDSKIPPSFTRPSYRFASYSGIPNPMSAPVKPPTAPPTFPHQNRQRSNRYRPRRTLQPVPLRPARSRTGSRSSRR